MAFGAAHEPSSSFLVFVGPDGFEASQDEPVELGDAVLDLGGIAQKPLANAVLEEPGGDVPVWLVIVFPLSVELFDFRFEGFQCGGLEVEKNERGKDVGVAQIGQVGGKIGDLEERFEGEEAGFDAPPCGINL